MGKGSKISLFVFKEGDMVNLLRVIENEDGSYSPYADKGEEASEPTFEKIVEDNGMLAKMMKLKEKMQNLSVRRQMRNSKSVDNEGESSSDSDVFVRESGASSVWDSRCVGQKPIAYKLLKECNNTFADKHLQIHENNFEAGEIALKEKHRTKSSLTAFPQETLQKHPKPKSLYSESKGNDSIIKQKYANNNVTKSQQKYKRERENVASCSSIVQRDVKNSDTNFLEPSMDSSADSSYSNLQFARLVPKTAHDGLELQEDAQEIWEIHDSTERLKESATCKIGVLKRRQSVDYAFDAKLGVENSQSQVDCYKNSEFEVFGGRNFYQLPQFVSNPSAIPPQYAPKEERMCDYILGNRFSNGGTIRRSPLYGRKPQSSGDDNYKSFESVPKIQQSSFPSGASNIERLRNDYVESENEFEKDISSNDSFLYNIACRSDSTGYSQLCLYSNKSAATDQLRLKTGEETSQDLAKEIKRIANQDSGERKVQLETVKLENLPAVRKKQLRCDQCNRKLNISNNYTCRCGRLFCAQHRYSEVHNCSHDYKTEGRLILERQNPLVVAEKLRKI